MTLGQNASLKGDWCKSSARSKLTSFTHFLQSQHTLNVTKFNFRFTHYYVMDLQLLVMAIKRFCRFSINWI